jgi:hypothetical protein
MTSRRDLSALGDARKDANALRSFLANAGITIKHTHALEAIAHIRGESNYHLLRHSLAKGQATQQVWVINTFGAGMQPAQRITHSQADALGWFAREVAIARVAIARSEIEVKVGGQPLPGLYAFTDGVLVVSATLPALATPGLATPLFAAEDALQTVANAITSLVWEDGNDWEEVRALAESSGADQFHTRYIEDEATRECPRTQLKDLPTADYERLMDAIAQAVRNYGGGL